MSLSAFTSNNLSSFLNIIDGNGSSTSNMTNWGYFFRKEQADNITGFNGTQMSNISTVPMSDFTLKYTPWGERRLHINDQPLDTTGVDNVYAALSSQHLTNIYGQNFNDKYGQGWSWYGSNTSDTRSLVAPVNGLKQIAANMLQMRSANTANLTSGGYRISKPVIGNNGTSGIPSSCFAHTPYYVINEFAVNLTYGDYFDSGRIGLCVYPIFFVEIVAPTTNPYGGNSQNSSVNPTYCLTVNFKKISMTIMDSIGSTATRVIQDLNYTVYDQSSNTREIANAPGWSGNKVVRGGFRFGITANSSTITIGTDPNYMIPNDWPYWPYEIPNTQVNTFQGHVPAFSSNWNFPWQIVGNVTFEMGDVMLYAGNTPDPNKLIDWIPGKVINALLGNGTSQTDVNGLMSGKIQLPKAGLPPTSFEIKQPAAGGMTGLLVENLTNGNFISAKITLPNTNGYWPFTANSSIGSTPFGNKPIISYSNRSSFEAGLNTYFSTNSTNLNLCTINVTSTNQKLTIYYAKYNPIKWTSGNLTINDPFYYWGSTALSRATANFCDINGMQNVSMQRIDPRIRGYGNSSTGYSSWVVAPNTFCRYVVNGNNTDIIRNMGGGSDSSNITAGHNTYNTNNGLRPSETSNRHIPGDPSPLGTNEPDYYLANEERSTYFPQALNTFDSTGNATFNAAHDLGKVPTNLNWRRLRFMPRHANESAQNLIPDWAMLDVISFTSNNSSSSTLKIAPVNPNGTFAVNSTLNSATYTRNNTVPALLRALASTTANSSNSTTAFELGSSVANRTVSGNLTFGKDNLALNPYMTGNLASSPYTYFRGNFTASTATTLANNIANRTWSTGGAPTPSTWGNWRAGKGWPSTSLVLPGEVTEISGIADYGARSQYDYSASPGARSIKENEGRLSAFFPGLTMQSNFFTIYAYAQAGQLQNKNQPESASNPFVVESEALTKTLVEVEITSPATASAPAQYKVKKLYTQPIPLGQ